jgi:hypothetical protein
MISTLDKVMYFKVILFQRSTKRLSTSQNKMKIS